MVATSLVIFAISVAVTASSLPSVYPVEEHIFDSVIDHFNFQPTTVPTFPLRYYVNTEHWNSSGSGPCFFYAGNEADIFQFINNTGFMFEISQEFGAMVVFAEHRYYGLSNPFGNENALGVPYNVSFLTVEQAMEDFNTLTVHMREKFNMATNTAFVAFGGSYGANLAMWLRLKNPNIWAGAIASSATPLKHLLREMNGFTKIETEAYGNVSIQCPEMVRAGWRELYENANTPQGRIKVAKSLSLCQPLPDEQAANDIHGWISNALETMVQYGYPYPTSFYNPVPAYPFRVACENMLQETTGLGALRAAASVYFNYTGQAGACFDFDDLVVPSATGHWRRKGQMDRLQQQRRRIAKRNSHVPKQSLRLEEASVRDWEETDEAWGYQCCTEVYQPMPTDGVTDFERPYTPNKTEYFSHCSERWGVVPRPDWEEMTFMGADISAGSNIFLTSGQFDPWRAAGIQTLPKGSPQSIVVRIIENGAHHLDLRAANEQDSPSVVAVRNEERTAIRQWIEDWRRRHHATGQEDGGGISALQ